MLRRYTEYIHQLLLFIKNYILYVHVYTRLNQNELYYEHHYVIKFYHDKFVSINCILGRRPYTTINNMLCYV